MSRSREDDPTEKRASLSAATASGVARNEPRVIAANAKPEHHLSTKIAPDRARGDFD
jgi:hypothetical protein